MCNGEMKNELRALEGTSEGKNPDLNMNYDNF